MGFDDMIGWMANWMDDQSCRESKLDVPKTSSTAGQRGHLGERTDDQKRTLENVPGEPLTREIHCERRCHGEWMEEATWLL
jgi:hypothetical protein